MSDPQDQVTAALGATRETKRIEFKSEFDPDLPGAWCELLKDIVAIANSGGGTILFGLDNSGRTCGWDARKLLDIDVADIANQLAKYTGEHFDDFTTHERIKSRKKIALMIVGGEDRITARVCEAWNVQHRARQTIDRIRERHHLLLAWSQERTRNQQGHREICECRSCSCQKGLVAQRS